MNENREIPTKWAFVSLAWELGYIIALPIIAFLWVGKRLDERWGTDPWLKIAGFAIAITVTSMWLGRRIQTLREMLRQKNK
jgi:hypothetical protein